MFLLTSRVAMQPWIKHWTMDRVVFNSTGRTAEVTLRNTAEASEVPVVVCLADVSIQDGIDKVRDRAIASLLEAYRADIPQIDHGQPTSLS